MKRRYTLAFILLMTPSLCLGQDDASSSDDDLFNDPFISNSSATLAIDLFIFSPSSFVYGDLSDDDEGKIDLYEDGSVSANVEFVTADFVTMFGKRTSENSKFFRLGTSFGVGLSTPSEGDTPVVMLKYGGVLQFGSLVRLEAGRVAGWTFDDDFSGSDARDVGWYVGIALPTVLSSMAKQAIRPKD